MQSRVCASALDALRAPTARYRSFWSLLTQTIRQAKGDDLKHEQFRQDLHYLYLVTAVHDHVKHGTVTLGHSTEEVADGAIQNAASMSTEAMYSAVNSSLCSSLRSTAGLLHDICLQPVALSTGAPDAAQPSLELQPDAVTEAAETIQQLPSQQTDSTTGASEQGTASPPEPHLGRSHEDSTATVAVRADDAPEGPPEPPYEPPRWLAGREMLTHREPRDQGLLELPPSASSDALTAAELRQAAARSLGFRTEVRKSGIAHEAAGDGVWLEGCADMGAIVAIHPGVAYSQAFHTEMKGFPNITADNDSILARYDNTLVDAKPWGRGQVWPGGTWVVVEQPLDAALNLVDGRHPLATAQFVNHPPPGVKPNMLLAPFDLRLADDEMHMRRFLPYVSCASTMSAILGSRVTGLVLVARRRLEDEELFMDYRLNPNHPRPAWYTPVDTLAEQRRWS